jgi:hypothetical protein
LPVAHGKVRHNKKGCAQKIQQPQKFTFSLMTVQLSQAGS